MSVSPLLVCVVDDDESVRESLPDLLREFGFEVDAFPSAEAFLVSPRAEEARCVIADIAMPGISGPDLQRELRRRGNAVPVIFITAHGEAADRPRLIREGAVDCLLKPFSEADLLRALAAALPAG